MRSSDKVVRSGQKARLRRVDQKGASCESDEDVGGAEAILAGAVWNHFEDITKAKMRERMYDDLGKSSRMARVQKV